MTLKPEEKEVLINLRLSQSEEALNDAGFLLKYKRLSAAANRVYYSIFYLISAVALKDGYSTSKHQQLLGWFAKNYIREGPLDKRFNKIIYTIFENRQKSDYDFLFKLTKDEVTKSVGEIKELIVWVKSILKQ